MGELDLFNEMLMDDSGSMYCFQSIHYNPIKNYSIHPFANPSYIMLKNYI